MKIFDFESSLFVQSRLDLTSVLLRLRRFAERAI
jgi:hypothetical protein